MGFWNTGGSRIMIRGVSADGQRIDQVSASGVDFPCPVPSNGYHRPVCITVKGIKCKRLEITYDSPTKQGKKVSVFIEQVGI